MAQGEEHLEFDTSETTIFSASIECSPTYTSTDKIECKFHLNNNDQQDYSVLKWRTPLDKMTSDCLTASCNGTKLQYDGVYMKRSTPGPDQFLLVGAGETLSSTFDVSDAYDMTEAGMYSIKMDSNIEYTVGSVKGVSDPSKQIQTKIVGLSSPVVSFQVVGRSSSKRTLGQKARSLEKRNQFPADDLSKGSLEDGVFRKRGQSSSTPRDPVIRRGPKAQKKATKLAHRVAFDHMKSAIQDLQNNHDRVETWFGIGRVSNAIKVFKTMGEILGKDRIKYVFGGKYCDSDTFGYTFHGTRKIFLCKSYERAETLSGFDSKVGILTHELSHALTYTDDRVYGQSACKKLAKKSPHLAVKNADNYEYFVESKEDN
ncbi:hypothetical protein ACROYT_G028100 [Oculina patagonica]